MYSEEDKLLQEQIEEAAFRIALERNNNEYNVLKEEFREHIRSQNSGPATNAYNKMVKTIDTMPDEKPSLILRRAIDVAGLAAVSKAPYLYSHIKRSLDAGFARLTRLGKLDKSCASVLDRAISTYEKRLPTIKDPEMRRGMTTMLSSLKGISGKIKTRVVNSPIKTQESANMEDEYMDMETFVLAETIDNLLSAAAEAGIYLDENNNIISENLRSVVRQTAGKVSTVSRQVARTVNDTANTAIIEKKKRDLISVRREVMDGRAPISRYIKMAVALVAIDAGAVPPLALGMLVSNLLRRRKLKQRERMNLLMELRTEMEIINEKIKDAEADNDRQKKYSYIRLRREIQRGIDQLKYGQRFAIDRAPMKL